MVKDTLTYLDYVKAAFHLKVPVKSLGTLPVNKLLLIGFGILGIGFPPVWLLGLAYEAAYLLYLSGNERFQRIIRLGQADQVKQSWADKERLLLSSLDNNARLRYQRLVDRCLNVLHAADGGAATGMEELKAGGLTQLLWIFLRLLLSQKRIREILNKTSSDELAAEIKEISAKLAREPETSAVYRSLKGTLDIQQRRMDNLSRATESLKVTEAELDRIEKQVTLLAEETAVSSNPEVLSVRLDGVVESLQGTTKWMSENAEYFGSLEQESLPSDYLSNPPKTMEGE